MTAPSFRALVDGAPEIVAVVDRERRFVFVSAAIERALGLPVRAVEGRTVGDVRLFDEPSKWHDAVDAVLRTGRESTVDGTITTALGHESVAAHDGPAALDLASSFRPVVAVLDIGLPVMDGYELARKLREPLGPEPLRLIAVTGYGQDDDRARARDAGFDHHLVEPIALDRLVPPLEAPGA